VSSDARDVHTETRGHKANDDAAHGRMGSVCEVLKPHARTPGGDPAVPPAPDAASKKRDGQVQRAQLEDLLRQPVPDAAAVADAAAYAAARARYATLRAFERKLSALYADGLTKCRGAGATVADLDARYPAHRDAFMDHYRRGLRESGIRVESVPFIRFLGDDS
jgi:hypothetical protein